MLTEAVNAAFRVGARAVAMLRAAPTHLATLTTAGPQVPSPPPEPAAGAPVTGQIMSLLNTTPGTVWSGTQLVEHLVHPRGGGHVDVTVVRATLSQLAARGAIRRVARGRYTTVAAAATD